MLTSTPTKLAHGIRQFISTHSIACVCDNDRCRIAHRTDWSPESSLKSHEWITSCRQGRKNCRRIQEIRALDQGWFSAHFGAREGEHHSSQPWLITTPSSPAKPWKIGISLSQSRTMGSTSDVPKNSCNNWLVASYQLQACRFNFFIRNVILGVYFIFSAKLTSLLTKESVASGSKEHQHGFPCRPADENKSYLKKPSISLKMVIICVQKLTLKSG